jgi:hypothetical protein
VQEKMRYGSWEAVVALAIDRRGVMVGEISGDGAKCLTLVSASNAFVFLGVKARTFLILEFLY